MTRRVVIEINFNNYGMDPERLSREWIHRRMNIFRSFTLRSLLVQSNQQFLAVIKLAGGCSDIVEAELAAHDPLPPHIRFGTSIESKRAIHAFAEGADELYIARLDSDDMYHRSFVQQLYDYRPQPGTVALINQNGYLWDSVNGEMAEAFHHSPQFYVFLYRTAEYAAGYRIRIPEKSTHGNVILLPHELLPRRNYVNVVHSSNTLPKKVPPHNRMSEEEMNRVLGEFMK